MHSQPRSGGGRWQPPGLARSPARTVPKMQAECSPDGHEPRLDGHPSRSIWKIWVQRELLVAVGRNSCIRTRPDASLAPKTGNIDRETRTRTARQDGGRQSAPENRLPEVEQKGRSQPKMRLESSLPLHNELSIDPSGASRPNCQPNYYRPNYYRTSCPDNPGAARSAVVGAIWPGSSTRFDAPVPG